MTRPNLSCLSALLSLSLVLACAPGCTITLGGTDPDAGEGLALTCAPTLGNTSLGKLITFEIGIRFLTDFLAGDVYFKVHREGHNLDRCRTQFKLVESIEQQAARMNQLVEQIG